MKVIDVRFRDPVQVGGITASSRVSWRREDGPCSMADGFVTCGDTLVPMTNVAWVRVESVVVPAPAWLEEQRAYMDERASRQVPPTPEPPAPKSTESSAQVSVQKPGGKGNRR